MDDNGMSRYMENNDEEGWDWVMSDVRDSEGLAPVSMKLIDVEGK